MTQTTTEQDEQVLYGDEMLTEGQIIEDDGLLIDDKTGEIIGPATKPDFIVDSPDAATWVLSLLSHEDAQLLAVRKEQEAINARFDKMAGARIRRREYLVWRYGAQIETVARGEIARAGGKLKTWRCAYGEVSFRLTKGTHRILDQLSAVAWAKRVAPAIVQVKESVNVSDVLPQLDDGEAPEWLETVPGGERCSIKTGVGG